MNKFVSKDGQEWVPEMTCSALSEAQRISGVEILPRNEGKKAQKKLMDTIMGDISLIPLIMSFCVLDQAKERDMKREEVQKLFDRGPFGALTNAFNVAFVEFVSGEPEEKEETPKKKRPTKGK